MRSAAADFIAGLPPRDIRRIGVMTPREVQFSRMDDASSPRDLRAFVMSVSPATNETRLWDAVDESLEDLKFGAGRRVIVVCSDGVDTSSSTSWRKVAEKARDFGVSIYDVAVPQFMGDRFPPVRRDPAMTSVTDETGGAFLEVKTRGDFPAVFNRLAEEIHTQYVISFVPSRPEDERR